MSRLPDVFRAQFINNQQKRDSSRTWAHTSASLDTHPHTRADKHGAGGEETCWSRGGQTFQGRPAGRLHKTISCAHGLGVSHKSGHIAQLALLGKGPRRMADPNTTARNRIRTVPAWENVWWAATPGSCCIHLNATKPLPSMQRRRNMDLTIPLRSVYSRTSTSEYLKKGGTCPSISRGKKWVFTAPLPFLHFVVCANRVH